MRALAKILAVSFAMMSISAWACTRPPQGDYDWVDCLRDGVVISYQGINHGLMDDKGNVLIESKDGYFSDDGGLIITKGNPMDEASRWVGVMDYQGNVIIPFEYEDMKSFADYFTANKNGKVLLLNHDNQVIEQ